MKMRLVLGRAGSGKTQLCLNEILQELSLPNVKDPLILIVPEQNTFETERLLTSLCKNKGFFRVHVVGFKRLSYRVFNQTGGASKPYITDLSKRLALSKLLFKHEEELKILKNLNLRNTLTETLEQTIKDFKNHNISLEKLEELSLEEDKIENPILKQKINDLCLLYKGFNQFLENKYIDPEDSLNLLTEKIPNSDLIKNAKVWIDGFSFFTTQEYQVIEAITTTAKEVNITLCLDNPEKDVFQYEDSIFYRQFETKDKLFEIASKINCQYLQKELAATYRFKRTPILENIEKSFVDEKNTSINPDIQNTPAFTLARAANKQLEIEAVSRQILDLVRNHNLRFKDIAIFFRNTEMYQEIVETTLADYNIPFFSDNNRKATNHPLANLIRSALELSLGNWNYEILFRALKTDLFALNRDDINILENYCLEFGITGRHFIADKDFNFIKRSYEDADLTDFEQNKKEEEFLAKINETRKTATTDLLNLSNILKDSVNKEVSFEFLAKTLYEFLIKLNIPETLESWAAAAEQKGLLAEAKEHRQIFQEILELLDQIVETFQDEKATLSLFSTLINEGLEAINLSLIPPGLDYVTITNIKRTKLQNIKAAFVLGVNEGIFPQNYTDSDFINESDREILLNLGIDIPQKSKYDIFEEQFLIYTALTRSSDYLWISYLIADDDGRSLFPSLIINKLKKFTNTQIKTYSHDLEELPFEYISTPDKTIALYPHIIKHYKDYKKLASYWIDVYNWALAKDDLKEKLRFILSSFERKNTAQKLSYKTARTLFSNKNVLKTSVTRFESFKDCPFKHFAKYGLKLKERPVYKLKALDLGQFLHFTLKSFGEKMLNLENQKKEITQEEVKLSLQQVIEQIAPTIQNEILTSSAHHRHLLKMLEKRALRSTERLIDFSQNTSFKPVALEKSFGKEENSLPPLVLKLSKGVSLHLTGQIDRIDKVTHNNQEYILVIDYKSGVTTFNLNEIFYGLKIQLITYLMAILELSDKKYLPAAAVYYYLKNPLITSKTPLTLEQVQEEINKSLKMSGWLLSDPSIVKLLDNSLPGNSEFFKVSLKGSDEFYKNCLTNLKSEEEFEAIFHHVKNELKITGEKILAGTVAISPYRLDKHTPCKYCPYESVCQFDPNLNENRYTVFKKLPEEEILAKIVNDFKGGA
ncbi:helicase-exonuclease AddAB subunit AddB [Selenomonadales bacterium OttesenSCG-928-I06]|nr:helicase-exonuclease AddAB subunit AddB [Selenomonadales bacterium OttesenSCG-928-I06]